VLKEAGDKSKKYDDIFGVDFKEFRNSNGDIIMWLWFGQHKFLKAIPPRNNPMRGIRLRKENIQIGNEDALQKLFKEDRGHNYFIGEVFAVSKELIPNSQRDYFNENPTRVEFENELRKFFHETLSPVFYGGSKLNSAYKAIDNYEKQVEQFEEKEKSGEFVDMEHRVSEIKKIEEAQKLSEIKRTEIEKLKEKGNSTITEVISRIEKERKCEKSTSETISLPQQSELYNTQTLPVTAPTSGYIAGIEILPKFYDVEIGQLDYESKASQSKITFALRGKDIIRVKDLFKSENADITNLGLEKTALSSFLEALKRTIGERYE
jgi:hypothetical protein